MFNFAYVIHSKCNKSFLQGRNNLIHITWGCNKDFSKWRPEILRDIEYLFFHNNNVFFAKKILYIPGIYVFRFDQFSLLMYLRLLPSSAAIKMDNGENRGNARYGTNDDTAGFINQMKNRNTSRNTEYDLKLIKNYFASIEEIRNVDGIPQVELNPLISV